jgi:glycolate oxidase iron-sulfur subunit
VVWFAFNMAASNSSPDTTSTAILADAAGRCVACGLCLPHCPTYRKTLSEADSPRGRIMLMKGALEGALPVNERLAMHLDLCLTCRACEAVCPNHVAYGRLVDGVRGHILGQRERSFAQRAALNLLARPASLRWLAAALRGYQNSGLQALMRRRGLLNILGLITLERELPRLPPAPKFARHYAAAGKQRERVALFLGCIARETDAETLYAAIHVMTRLGYAVEVPPAQTCCGALHRHAGNVADAARLEERNRQAFAATGVSAILTTASGCGAPLQEAGGTHAPVIDISAFLADADGWNDVAIAPLQEKILVHDPCSLRNVMRAAPGAYRLLERIPGARVEPLSGNGQCCGAAGTYFLSQPAMAAALLDDKMAALAHQDARYLATSNVGCAMHLAKGLRERGSRIEVVHPVTLLARQMGYCFP